MENLTYIKPALKYVDMESHMFCQSKINSGASLKKDGYEEEDM